MISSFIMNRISVSLQNCYGIKKLDYIFDFSSRKAYAIYAPNGSMKSSFAETFKNLANGTHPQDRIFPKRVSVCKITDENGSALPQPSVLVLPPYDEFFIHTEKTSTLLVNNAMRKEYEALHINLNATKTQFLQAMKEQSGGSKKQLDREIALAFRKNDSEDDFYAALIRIKDELKEQRDTPFESVPYDAIFDEKVLSALEDKNCKAAIKEYVTKYNDLLSASTYFKQGVFEYYNASQIAKILEDNGFFSASHTITLNAGKKLEIKTRAQLEALISTELDGITNDQELKKKFSAIKKILEKNVSVREFQQYLTSHILLLPQLANIDLFKENIWKSYLKKHENLFNKLVEQYNTVKARKAEIVEAARNERTQWESAIDLFNDRFIVPYRLEAKNKTGVLLGIESMLDLGYTFKEGSDSMPVQRETLMKSLSQGEKKALYILNIIFDIEVRRNTKQETLFVIDDIADSFDYKNKYAIIQYLAEISDGPMFKQIILTHNFDFFRTISSRFVGYDACLMVTKNQSGVQFAPAAGIKNIFVNDWKVHFFDDPKKRIASIPFMRNLIEFTNGTGDADYKKLTSLLHWKGNSTSITQGDLDNIYIRLFGGSGSYAQPAAAVVDMINNEAIGCLTATAGLNFENKIVLSIATRLCAEKFMITKIANAAVTANIEENQTPKLLKAFQSSHPQEASAIRNLRNVILMTPENIHLNAFMYEPILDMSDEHLRRLYQECCALK